MRVALCSIFMDSMDYMDRYWDQVMPLRDQYDLSVSVAEGDSTDGTKDFTEAWNRVCPANYQFLTVDHGGQKYGNIDHPQRWAQIAQVVKPTIQRALAWDPDVLVWVESDLMWETEVMTQLIERTAAGPMRTSTPMVLAGGTERFYDIWGHRINGHQFHAWPPYWSEEDDHLFREPGSDLLHIDSCGNCFATNDLESLKVWNGHWPYRAPMTGNIKLHTDLIVRHP